MFLKLGLSMGTGGAGGGSVNLKASLSFPIGQAIPDGYAATDADLPFAAAHAQFDSTVPENRAKPNRTCTITNSGVLFAERVYSFTTLNTDIAASFAAVNTLHVFHDPTREPTGLTVSASGAATNYWQDVLTERVTAYSAGVTGFSAIPVIELANELVIPGGYASSIYKTAAAADGAWTLGSEIAAAVVLYDALDALGQTHRYAIGEYQIEDGGLGVGVDPVPVNHGISRARKRAQMVKFWHDFLDARPFRPIMRMQGHIQAEVPFYPSELQFFIDELAGMLRIDIGVGELNTTWEDNDQLFPISATDAIKRDYSASFAAFICRQIALRAGLDHVIGWTDYSSDGLDRMTIMESGQLSVLGRALKSNLRNLPAATLAKRALAPVAFGTAAEAQALPYWSGITTVGWGAYGTGGVMALDLDRFKARTTDGGVPAKALTHNASIVWYGRIKSVTSGMTLFELKDGASNVLASAQTTVSGTISVTLQGTTTDLGAYAADDLVKIAVDQDGTTAMRAAMGRYTTGDALVQSSVVSKAAPAATDAATMVFPEASGEVRAFAVELHYDTSRLSTDPLMMAALNPRPENYINPTTLGTLPVSLSITGSSIPENTAQGVAVGVATPVNSSNPDKVRVISQSLANALAMEADGRTVIVGSGYAALNYEVVQEVSATFEVIDDKGIWQATQIFPITDVADGPTTAGAPTDLETFFGTPTIGIQSTGDLDDIIISPSGRAITFSVSHGTVGAGNAWAWTPAASGDVTITVTATDEDGQQVTVLQDVTVSAANQAPVAVDVTLTIIVPPPPAAVAPTNTVVPVITGTQKVGNTLSSDSGTWTGDAPITFAYKWQRSDNGTSGWADISAATASTYAIVAADDTKYLRCVVTGTNATGSADGNSLATAQILYDAPVNTVAPVITGTATEGQTLTGTDGTWANSPSISRKWQTSPDGSTSWTDLGDTDNTFALTSGEVSEYISLYVTGTNSGGAVNARSNVIGPIAAASAGITLVGWASDNGDNNTNAVLDLTALTGGSDTAPSVGDYIIIFGAASSGVDSDVTISDGTYAAIGTDQYMSDSFKVNTNVFAKYYTGTPEASVSINGSSNTTGGNAAVAVVLRGVDATTQLDVAVVQNGSLNTALADANAITPATAGAWIIAGGGIAQDLTPDTFTGPANMTDYHQVASVGSSRGNIAWAALKTDWAFGAFDPDPLTGGTNSTSFAYGAFAIAVRPA